MRKILHCFYAISFLWVAFLNPREASAQCTPAQSSITLTIDLSADGFPTEDGWKIINDATGMAVDSACFGSYPSASVYTYTTCLDTGDTYTLYALDDFGDGLDGAEYRIAYTFASGIDTIGANNFEIPFPHCGAVYTTNEIADSSSFYVTYVAPPACLDPTIDSVNSTTTTADIYWTEIGSATQWQIEYDTAGFIQGTGNISVVTNNFYTATGLSSGTSYDFYVRSICSSTDSSGWAGPLSFRAAPPTASGVSCTSPGAIASIVFSEEFDNNNAGWTGDINSGNSSWEIPDDATSTATGADAAYSGANYMNFEASSQSTNQGSIISPAISLAGAVDDAELSFWMHAYGLTIGTLEVGVGTSSTGPFTTEFTWTGQLQTSGSDPWVNVGVDLSSYIGQTIYIQLTQIDDNNSNGGSLGFDGDMSIDLFEVTTCQSCALPNSLAEANLTSSSVDLSWINPNSSDAFVVEYDTAGFVLGTGTQVTGNGTSVSISGLMPTTDYEWYVRSVCTPGSDSSSFVGPMTFTTLCAPFVAPYTESFDVNTIPTCWTSYEAAGDGWQLGNSSINSAGFAAGNAFEQTGNGGFYAYIDFSGSDDDSTCLESNFIDVSSLTTPALAFKLFSNNTNNATYNTLFVDYYDGSAWNTLDTLQGELGGWSTFTYDISSAVIGSNVKIRFRGQVSSGASPFVNDLLIDDVMFMEYPPQVPFTLVSPPNGTILDLATGTATSTAVASWTSSNIGSEYTWHIDAPSGDFSSPIRSYLSDNEGADTTITIPFTFLDALLYSLGVSDGDTAFVKWTVTKESSGITTFADTSFILGLVKAPTGGTLCSSPVAPVSISDDTLSFCVGDSLFLSGSMGGWPLDWTYNGMMTDTVVNSSETGMYTAVNKTEFSVGPQTSIASNAFPSANFINGQFFTATQDFILDSVTLSTDDSVEVFVLISDTSRSADFNVLFTSSTFTLPSAGEYRVPIDLLIPAGNYFISIVVTGGPGVLFRTTGGAVYPYTVDNIVTITGTDFTTQSRYYYTFDWAISTPCVDDTPDSVFTEIDSNTVVSFTSVDQGGGTYDFTASITGSYDSVMWDFGDTLGTSTMLNPTYTYASSNTYTVTLTVYSSCGDTILTDVVSVVLGIENSTSGFNVNRIFPNPTNGQLTVQLSNVVGNAEITVMDLSGRIVLNRIAESGDSVQEDLDISDLDNGVYMIQIINDSKAETHQIIKK